MANENKGIFLAAFSLITVFAHNALLGSILYSEMVKSVNLILKKIAFSFGINPFILGLFCYLLRCESPFMMSRQFKPFGDP